MGLINISWCGIVPTRTWTFPSDKPPFFFYSIGNWVPRRDMFIPSHKVGPEFTLLPCALTDEWSWEGHGARRIQGKPAAPGPRQPASPSSPAHWAAEWPWTGHWFRTWGSRQRGLYPAHLAGPVSAGPPILPSGSYPRGSTAHTPCPPAPSSQTPDAKPSPCTFYLT